MEIKIKSYSSQSSLLSSILSFIFGAILLTSADKVVEFAYISIGIILAVTGIINLVVYIFKIKHEMTAPKHHIFTFILTTILAIIFIFFSGIIDHFIRFIVGGWILLTGITRLINVLSISPKNRKFLPLLIVSILLMIVGIYTIVINHIILQYIGIIMMIYAVIEIVGYIFYTKDTIIPDNNDATTLTIQGEDENESKINLKKEVKDIEAKDITEKKSKKKKKDEK